MTETELSAAIRAALARLGIWVIRVQAGTHRVKGGMLHCAEPGTPDLMLPALAAWLEVKTQDGALEASQLAWHLRATREGVKVATVRTVQEAVAVVREWQTERALVPSSGAAAAMRSEETSRDRTRESGKDHR